MQEFARRHGDFALVAVVVALPDDGEPRVVLGGVGDVPVRAREAERLLAAGESPEAAARAAAEEIEPGHDLHASPDYRRRLAATLVRRAAEEAAEMDETRPPEAEAGMDPEAWRSAGAGSGSRSRGSRTAAT